MQETIEETLVRYFVSNARFDFLATLIRQKDLTGTANVQLP